MQNVIAIRWALLDGNTTHSVGHLFDTEGV
jgi:hypothetical protein